MSVKTPEHEVVVVNSDVLAGVGFTTSGQTQFENTVSDYARTLLERSIKYGEIKKATNLQLEISHEDVRSSAHSIAATFGAPITPLWLVGTNVLEYVATAAAGVGGGNLSQAWGIATFGIGLSVAVILVVVRLTKGKGG